MIDYIIYTSLVLNVAINKTLKNTVAKHYSNNKFLQ